jgi:hypothetical protein
MRIDMGSGFRSRTQYLSLARFSHELIVSLYDLLDGNSNGDLKRQLKEAIEALKAVREGDLYRFGQRRAAAFGTVEQVQTLNTIWSKADIHNAIRLMDGLLSESARPHRADSAQQLIDLLSKLRTKALWNFEQTVVTAGRTSTRLAIAQ